jgi:hypothetical protein
MKIYNIENFLLSFNNKSNGFAKVVNINGNVILGHLGNFGYAVFELQKDGYFNNVTEFTTLQESEKKFNERIDQTGMLSLDEKIKLIKNNEIKSFIKERIVSLKNDVLNLERWRSIQAIGNLESLSKMTTKELEELAKSMIQTIKANNVLFNRFLIVK